MDRINAYSNKSQSAREKVGCLALTVLVHPVFCSRLPVILLYGLPNVEMVGQAKRSWYLSKFTKRQQATFLYPIRRRCSTPNNELLDCLYYVLGIVPLWRF